MAPTDPTDLTDLEIPAFLGPAGEVVPQPPREEADPDQGAMRPQRRIFLGRLDPHAGFLDGTLKWVGLGLILTTLAPMTFVLGLPRFLWDLLPDEVASLWPSLLALPVAGVAFVVLWRRRWSKAAKGCAALAILLIVILLAPLSPEVTAGLFNGLPVHFWHHSLLYLSAFALLAAASLLAAETEGAPWARPVRTMALAGTVLLGLFYLLPQRGEVPLFETFRNLGNGLEGLPSRVKLGIWANRVIVLAPVVMWVVAGISVARRRPLAPNWLFGFFGAVLPVLCLVLGIRIAMSGSGWALLLNLRNAVILGGAVIVAAAAVAAIHTQLWIDLCREDGHPSELWRDRLLALSPSPDPGPPGVPGTRAPNPILRWLATRRARDLAAERDLHGDPAEPLPAYLRRRLAGAGPTDPAPASWSEGATLPRLARGWLLPVMAVALLGAVLATRSLLAPDWKTGGIWELRHPDAQTTELFARKLPWYVARLDRARRTEGAGRPAAWERLARARREMLAAASRYPVLARALRHFAAEVERPGYRPKTAARRIAAVDRAAHAAGLPFVVEPVVWTRREGGGRDHRQPWKRTRAWLRPRVALKVFTVRRLRSFRENGARYTAAWVKRLDRLNLAESHLGRSWRGASYALVLVDEARDWADRALLPVLRGELPGEWDPGSAGLRAALGELLRAGLRTAALGVPDPSPARLARLVALSTERHELEHEADRDHIVPNALHRRMPSFSDRSVLRTSRELKAYLAQMSTPVERSGAAMPAVVLARMVRLAARPAYGTAEWFAARLIVARMATELGISGEPDGGLSALAVQVAAGAAASVARIPAAAARIYEDLFGRAPARFTLTTDSAGSAEVAKPAVAGPTSGTAPSG